MGPEKGATNGGEQTVKPSPFVTLFGSILGPFLGPNLGPRFGYRKYFFWTLSLLFGAFLGREKQRAASIKTQELVPCFCSEDSKNKEAPSSQLVFCCTLMRSIALKTAARIG